MQPLLGIEPDTSDAWCIPELPTYTLICNFQRSLEQLIDYNLISVTENNTVHGLNLSI